LFLPRTAALLSILTSGVDTASRLRDLQLDTALNPHAIDQAKELFQNRINGRTLIGRAGTGNTMCLVRRDAPLGRVVTVHEERVRAMLKHR